MEEVLHYLDLKNQYYEKFLRITEKFHAGAVKSEWENINAFTDTRERILSIIRQYDFRIAQVFNSLDVDPGQVLQYRPRVKALLDRRAELVHRIVAVDLEIIHLVDDVKSDALRGLRAALENHEEMTDEVSPSSRGAKPLSS